LATLKSAPIGELKQKWRDLFDRDPPPYNRRFLEDALPTASKNSPMAD
jgi:hypothetical protein